MVTYRPRLVPLISVKTRGSRVITPLGTETAFGPLVFADFGSFRVVSPSFPTSPGKSSRGMFSDFSLPHSLRFAPIFHSPIRSDSLRFLPTVLPLPMRINPSLPRFSPACRTIMSPGLPAFPSVGFGVLGRGFAAALGLGVRGELRVGGCRRIWGLGLGFSRRIW